MTVTDSIEDIHFKSKWFTASTHHLDKALYDSEIKP